MQQPPRDRAAHDSAARDNHLRKFVLTVLVFDSSHQNLTNEWHKQHMRANPALSRDRTRGDALACGEANAGDVRYAETGRIEIASTWYMHQNIRK